VERYALNAAAHLTRRGVKLLVVACNTATSFALPRLEAACDVPVVGVVEPGVRAALELGARRVGVIGTEGTIRSGAYQRALERLDGDVEVRAAACPLFVPLAEEGWGDHPVTDRVARIYLEPLLGWGIQALILGCTHYPLLMPSLERVVGPGVTLIDSASAVARAVAEVHPGPADGGGDVEIHLTDASDHFLRVARAILGAAPRHLEVVHLEG
jgi:glutamate racemase